jgi:hypothetical protein
MKHGFVTSLVYITIALFVYVLLLGLNSPFIPIAGILLGGINVFLTRTYCQTFLSQLIYLIVLGAIILSLSALLAYFFFCADTVKVPYCGSGMMILSGFPFYVSVVIWLALLFTRKIR